MTNYSVNGRFVQLGIVGILLVLPGNGLPPSSADAPAQTETQIACGRRVSTRRARSPQDVLVPYAVSPRATLVSQDRPELRWNLVPGGSRYQVSLMNGETVVWTREATTNQMAYPSDVAPLQPGIDYMLQISADNGHSSREDTSNPSFHLISAAEAVVLQQADSLLTIPASTDQTALLQASFYAGSGLYSDAIATLEARVNQGSQSPTLYRQLGQLYAETGLSLLAERTYLAALPLSANQLEEQAQIQANLGYLYREIEEEPEAMRWFNEAKQSYAKLGNQYQVRQMEEALQPDDQSAV